jgi:hypothetical protein
MKKQFLLFLGVIAGCFLQAQWVSDPFINTLLSKGDTTYSYGVFRESPMDSSYFHLYYNHVDDPSVNYVIYLQKYDFNGLKQWENEGILISGGPQRTWVPDMNLAFNHDSCMYVAYSRIVPPTGTTDTLVHIYMNKVTLNGEKLWGNEGIDISEPDDFGDYGPELVVTQQNNIVISYDNSFLDEIFEELDLYKVKVKQYAPDGSLMWSQVMPHNPANMDWGSRLVELDNHNLMILYKHDTIFEDPDTAALWYDQCIRSWQFDVSGNPVFEQPKQVFKYPKLFSDVWMSPIDFRKDKNGGLYFSANYAQDYVSRTFIQYLDENSDTLFPHAMSVSTGELANTERGNYSLAYDEEMDELVVFWIEKVFDPQNPRNSIMGQKFNMDGQRVWGDEGKLFHPFVSMFDTIYGWPVVKHTNDDHVLFFFLENILGDEMVNLKAEKYSLDGIMVWPEQILMSGRPDVKAGLCVTNEVNEQFVATWNLDLHDFNISNSILYGQNIKTNGHIGTGINDYTNKEISVSIFPNPVGKEQAVNIKLTTQSSSNISIRMINLQGQEILTWGNTRLSIGENVVEIPLNHIPDGIYLINVVTAEGLYNGKLIVQ